MLSIADSEQAILFRLNFVKGVQRTQLSSGQTPGNIFCSSKKNISTITIFSKLIFNSMFLIRNAGQGPYKNVEFGFLL